MSLLRHCALVVLGVTLTQVILFGPSLLGHKLLLPLDLLSLGGTYLPRTEPYLDIQVNSVVLSDQVLNYEPARRFAADEMRAGRLPLWTPYEYAGTPFAGWAKYSPFQLLYTLFPTPFVLAWVQLLQSLIAGVGAFVFFHRTLNLRGVPAGIAACAFPICGFFALWQGFPIAYPVAFFPWMLATTDAAIRRPRSIAGPVLAMVTALVVVSGQLDMAALVLTSTGLFAVWRLAVLRNLPRTRPAATVVAAWALGLVLSSIFSLPILEYADSGHRMHAREKGIEERPPTGWSAIPQIVLPEIYGMAHRGSVRIVDGNRPESSAAAYAGLLATLWAAPLGFFAAPKRYRGLWLLFLVAGLGWQVGLPVLVDLMRLPRVNLLSYNRWVFLAAFAVLGMSAQGLDSLWGQGRANDSQNLNPRTYLGFTILVGALGSWCIYQARGLSASLTARIATHLAGQTGPHADPAQLDSVLQGFRASYLVAALLCALAVLGWIGVAASGRSLRSFPRPLVLLLGSLMLCDLLWHGAGISSQADPQLNYPTLDVLRSVAEAQPAGRQLCLGCLPPGLSSTVGLRDVRGYDAVDPQALIETLDLARDRRFPSPRYAVTQYYVPQFRIVDGQIDLPPALDMLGVRFLIGRGLPPPSLRVMFRSDDYWVGLNPQAMPRLWVPGRIEIVENDAAALAHLADPTFEPRDLAVVVEGDFPLGSHPRFLEARGTGSAQVVAEVPNRVTAVADMETAGLLILGDRWTSGWRVTVDGEEHPVVRVDHLLRGVFLETGRHDVVFTYRPAAFVWGLAGFASALLLLGVWITWVVRSGSQTADSTTAPSDGLPSEPATTALAGHSASSAGS